MTSFEAIGIGSQQPTFIICEIAQAHDGSVGIAHSMIDAAADAGVNAVKFQTHIASEESTYDDQFRVPFSFVDETRYDYWKRMEFSLDQWNQLAKHATAKGLQFISSPFSITAVDLLESIGVKFWKIGSGELLNLPLVKHIATTGKPIIASTGLHSWAELDRFVASVEESRAPLAILQCTSSYPSSLEEVGINVMQEIRNRYGCLSGLSDHSGKLSPSLYAIAHGASIVEIHATFDRRMFGPDASSSLTFSELQDLVSIRDEFHTLQMSPVDKDENAIRKEEVKRLFGRSLSAATDLNAGHVMEYNDFCLRKPGSGISPELLDQYVGRKLCSSVTAQRLLRESDFEQ